MKILADWEKEWLFEMGRAFWGSPSDMKWLRDVRKKHNIQRPHKLQCQQMHIVPSIHPKMKAQSRVIFRRALYRAAKIVQRATEKGLLPKLDGNILCVDCGIKPAIAYEHRDYAKPLEVQPVCQPCNMKRGPAILSAPVPTRKRRAA